MAAADKELLAAENEVQWQVEAKRLLSYEQSASRVKDFEHFRTERDILAPRVAAADRSEEQAVAKRADLKTLQAQFTALREQYAGVEWQAKDWARKIETLANQQGQCDVCNSPLPDSESRRYPGRLRGRLASGAGRAEARQSRGQSSQIADDKLRKRTPSALDAQVKAAKEDRARLAQADSVSTSMPK